MAKHAPFITVMVPGMVKIITKDERSFLYATSGGTVEVNSNRITMLAESIIPKEEINVSQAQSEKTDAENQLHAKMPGIDKEALLLKLNTAKAKLSVAGM